MDIQRLRNLTTGRLHTEMAHIYQELNSSRERAVS